MSICKFLRAIFVQKQTIVTAATSHHAAQGIGRQPWSGGTSTKRWGSPPSLQPRRRRRRLLAPTAAPAAMASGPAPRLCLVSLLLLWLTHLAAPLQPRVLSLHQWKGNSMGTAEVPPGTVSVPGESSRATQIHNSLETAQDYVMQFVLMTVQITFSQFTPVNRVCSRLDI